MYTTKKSWAFNPEKQMLALSAAFLPGEELEALVVLNGAGVLTISRQRLAFFKLNNPVPEYSVAMVDIEKVEIEKKGLGRNTYSVVTSEGAGLKLGGFLMDDEAPAIEILNSCIATAVPIDAGDFPSVSPTVQPTASGSVTDELTKLSELLSSGVLTEEEFVLAKSKLLGL